MVDLVNICAPADAPVGAPLLFDPDAPGHCRWGTQFDAQALDSMVSALKAMASKMQELEARNQQLDREAEELKQRLAQVEAPLRALAEEAKRRMEAA
jgi:septal ring factor EnvC (AmiA/AmiB activator)